ncbi:MAG TPA: protein kinase [Pyrinomonadaceae bacterium]
MRAEIDIVHNPFGTLPESSSEKWRGLCASYLPVKAEASIWRYSRAPAPADPEQGWKLHVSATILTANVVFERAAPFLSGRGVLFKAPATLQELERINSGLYHGYSQIGKFITVYPQSDAEARLLAGRLHRLTRGLSAPAIPFDLRFRPDSNVYYRYGAFVPLRIEHPDGTSTLAMRDPQGNLVPDLRESVEAKPAWVGDPLIAGWPRPEARAPESPLRTSFRAFRSLTQRGKGGVYQAVDLTTQTPRLCVLKEGRRDGEPAWDGRDGHWRVRQEERVLKLLRAGRIDAPRVYASFEAGGNYYLVTEFIEGESLQNILQGLKRRMSVSRVLRYGVQLATLVSQIHSAGWVWRDCKPSNVMVTKKGTLRPLDFEGACPVDEPDPVPWSTPEFAPPESRATGGGRARVCDDLYALGAVIYFLLTGRPPAASSSPLAKLRRNIPTGVSRLVEALLSADPRRRPCAQMVAERLKALGPPPRSATRPVLAGRGSSVGRKRGVEEGV